MQAAPEIQSEIPESRLVLLLSDQPQKQYLELCKEAQELSPFARINILPSIKENKGLYSYLRDADCIVIPSITEGFGLSAAETCSLGIPIVATRAGSLPEVVSGCYLMIEPASSKAITKAVVQMYHKDWYETPLKKFSWVVMLMHYETIYLKLIKT